MRRNFVTATQTLFRTWHGWSAVSWLFPAHMQAHLLIHKLTLVFAAHTCMHTRCHWHTSYRTWAFAPCQNSKRKSRPIYHWRACFLHNLWLQVPYPVPVGGRFHTKLELTLHFDEQGKRYLNMYNRCVIHLQIHVAYGLTMEEVHTCPILYPLGQKIRKWKIF